MLAFESVHLYGLPLAERRRISYAAVDPGLCRSILIRDGLVAGAVKRPLPFLEHNLALVAELLDREARSRERGVLVSEGVQASLYEERLPADVSSLAGLERWWRRAEEAQRARLFFTEADLSEQAGLQVTERDFPSSIALSGVEFELKYRFAPGEPDDGISVQVPIGALSALVPEALEWSVPGFFAAVCEQWLRSLPKSKRRLLTPIPDCVSELLPRLMRGDRYRSGRLAVALASAIEDLRGVRVDAEDWDRSRIDPHLRMNVQVLDDSGKVIAQGRDLAALQERFAREARARVSGDRARSLERSGLVAFPEELTLGESRVIEGDGGKVVAYPALVDQGDHVDVRMLASATEQHVANRRGFTRLALLRLGATTREMRKRLEREETLGLHYAPLGSAAVLMDQVLCGVVWYACFEGRPLPRDAAAFDAAVEGAKPVVMRVYQETVSCLAALLGQRFALARHLDAMTSPAFADAVADVRAHLERLVPADVLWRTPRAYLPQLSRYLEAIAYRLEHLQGRVSRDREAMAVVQGFEARLKRLSGVAASDDWQAARFAVEELRVALFAEPLGTRGKVSPKRLARVFLDLERQLGLA